MGAARVVTATSGATNIALAKSFGADLVIDYKVEDIFSALPDDSVDLVYDSTQMT
jgi:NADPH:quinone reductase-like Zn-dependent oxidoreductase|eukprot:COSAG02_NODE_4081_length_5808_cov_4.838501_3_plen_55_part_00